MLTSLVETWRQIIHGGEKAWVLFKDGTCVIFGQTKADIAQQATELMKE